MFYVTSSARVMGIVRLPSTHDKKQAPDLKMSRKERNTMKNLAALLSDYYRTFSR